MFCDSLKIIFECEVDINIFQTSQKTYLETYDRNSSSQIFNPKCSHPQEDRFRRSLKTFLVAFDVKSYELINTL